MNLRARPRGSAGESTTTAHTLVTWANVDRGLRKNAKKMIDFWSPFGSPLGPQSDVILALFFHPFLPWIFGHNYSPFWFPSGPHFGSILGVRGFILARFWGVWGSILARFWGVRGSILELFLDHSGTPQGHFRLEAGTRWAGGLARSAKNF